MNIAVLCRQWLFFRQSLALLHKIDVPLESRFNDAPRSPKAAMRWLADHVLLEDTGENVEMKVVSSSPLTRKRCGARKAGARRQSFGRLRIDATMMHKQFASRLGSITLLAAVSLSAMATPATSTLATDIVRQSVGAFPISSLVSVPPGSDLIYVSGTTAEPVSPGAPLGDTKTQTVAVLQRIQSLLKGRGASLGDIVMMRVFLVGDPALGGKMDFAGMMAGYSQFFGTTDQPNKPARTTVQVAGLAAPVAMVEIEAQVAKLEPVTMETVKAKS